MVRPEIYLPIQAISVMLENKTAHFFDPVEPCYEVRGDGGFFIETLDPRLWKAYRGKEPNGR